MIKMRISKRFKVRKIVMRGWGRATSDIVLNWHLNCTTEKASYLVFDEAISRVGS